MTAMMKHHLRLLRAALAECFAVTRSRWLCVVLMSTTHSSEREDARVFHVLFDFHALLFDVDDSFVLLFDHVGHLRAKSTLVRTMRGRTHIVEELSELGDRLFDTNEICLTSLYGRERSSSAFGSGRG